MTNPDHTHLREHLMAVLETHGHQLDALEAHVGSSIAPTHSPNLISPFTYEGPFMLASPVNEDQYVFDLSLADLIHEHAERIAELEAKIARIEQHSHPPGSRLNRVDPAAAHSRNLVQSRPYYCRSG
ncbi:hypothetical protein [Stomatohabitans albus]|uniref:hypothetical protein n=1 Tax=Stomatohabitans albus TaxID=3110766 RepID=UPI00300D6611